MSHDLSPVSHSLKHMERGIGVEPFLIRPVFPKSWLEGALKAGLVWMLGVKQRLLMVLTVAVICVWCVFVLVAYLCVNLLGERRSRPTTFKRIISVSPVTFDLLPISTISGATYRPSHDAACFVCSDSTQQEFVRADELHFKIRTPVGLSGYIIGRQTQTICVMPEPRPVSHLTNTVMVHVDSQESRLRIECWLARVTGSKEGENIPVMYYWCLTRRSRGVDQNYEGFRLKLEQWPRYQNVHETLFYN